MHSSYLLYWLSPTLYDFLWLATTYIYYLSVYVFEKLTVKHLLNKTAVFSCLNSYFTFGQYIILYIINIDKYIVIYGTVYTINVMYCNIHIYDIYIYIHRYVEYIYLCVDISLFRIAGRETEELLGYM